MNVNMFIEGVIIGSVIIFAWCLACGTGAYIGVKLNSILDKIHDYRNKKNCKKKSDN